MAATVKTLYKLTSCLRAHDMNSAWTNSDICVQIYVRVCVFACLRVCVFARSIFYWLLCIFSFRLGIIK